MSKQLMMYVPVIHAGYEAMLARHRNANEVLLLGGSFAEEFPVMKKEIRALPAERAAHYLSRVEKAPQVRVIERDDLPDAVVAEQLVVPDEDILRELIARHDLKARHDVLVERTFLRWDREWSQAQRPVAYDGRVTGEEADRRLADMAVTESERSSDWWRQVGAIAVREGRILVTAHNRHYPSEYAPYLNGDPRNNFKRGIRIDLSTAMHAEAAIVAQAAREGTSLAGADLYVSTFPCPGCARLVAEAGFTRCYFAGPYSMLDGEEILRSAGVELMWVDTAVPEPAPH